MSRSEAYSIPTHCQRGCQCEFPSNRMSGMGGCSSGTDEQKTAWRVAHMTTGRYSRLHLDPAFCSRQALWNIGGMRLCALHTGQVALEMLRGTYVQPPSTTTETDMTQTIAQALGLAALLEPGGALQNMRGHAARLGLDISAAAAETGGDPNRSPRYRDAQAIVALVDDVERICDGTFTHPPVGPQPWSRTLQVLSEVERERERQWGKGFADVHDDEHADGLIADQAAHAISVRGLSPEVREPWIEGGSEFYDDRRKELIKGIALAVAEVERLDRAEDKRREEEARG